MTDKISINDIGTSLQITVQESDAALDISTATAKSIILKKPGGEEVEKTADFITDGTDGGVKYATEAGVIDQKGIWSYRAKITFSASMIFHTIDSQVDGKFLVVG